MLFDFGWNNPKSHDSFFMRSHVYSHKMSLIMCVCSQGVGCGCGDRGGPCVLHGPGYRVVRDGPVWWRLWEVCRNVPLNNGKSSQVGHITFMPPSLSPFHLTCLFSCYLLFQHSFYSSFLSCIQSTTTPPCFTWCLFLVLLFSKLLLNIVRGVWLNKHHC